ncbi:MAG: hypothetical protein LCI03_14070 [Actinobacteria bacterium]|jgi:hypothetical protein|nr:hypothetical protein [Actinomycetota bacterium]
MDAITTTTQTVATVSPLVTATRVDLDALALAIAEDGVAASTPRVLSLVLEARELGADAGLVELLADDTAGEIVRMRAFGMLAGQVEALRRPLPHPADILSA